MTDSVNAQDFDPALTGTQTVQVQEAINEALRRRITEDLAADSEIQNRLFGEDTDWKATTLALQKRVVDLERLRELSAVVAAKPTEYPRKDGDVLVLGPELISTPELECLLHDWSYIRNAEPCNECKSTKNLSLRRRKQGWVLECGCGDCCHEGFGFQPWNAVQDWYERISGDVDREGHP